ncbi:MAG: methyltransferase domain-containing protein [Acidobacteriota bacterium]|nr:MAG: methyltransferase domain-containing protein [Acidobacteriota bacterium]
MNEKVEFLNAFLKNPLSVGAVAPSGPELSRKMVDGLEPSKDSIILELGVGTGAVTKAISGILPDDESYLGIELNDRFIDGLRNDFPALKFMQGDAGDASALHKESGLGKVGYVISSLPFVSLPGDVTERILGEIEKFMEQGCIFRTFQYAHGYYLPAALKLREFMRDRYGVSERSPIVMRNVPPAYTLTWRGPAS